MKIVYLILLYALFTGCGTSDDKSKQTQPSGQRQTTAKTNSISFTPEQNKNGGIDTGRLTLHEMSGDIQVNGQVDVPPGNLVNVNVPMGGFLKRANMLPGQPVIKGQIIAEVENQEYITLQQDYLTSTSKMVFLKQELDRQRHLSDQQASPLKLYQQSMAEYNSEQAQASGIGRKLMMLGINPKTLTASGIRSVIAIRSPISGFVSQVKVNTGSYIGPTDILMELVNTSDIHAALTVFEQDIPQISIGSMVAIKLPNMPGKTYPGRVMLIGRMLDSTHSVMVHCHFLKIDASLLPNMFLQATIKTKARQVLAVPDDALVNYAGKQCIFTAKPHGDVTIYTLIPVEIGIRENGWNEVKLDSSKVAHDLFVMKGAFSILSAMKNTGDDGE